MPEAPPAPVAAQTSTGAPAGPETQGEGMAMEPSLPTVPAGPVVQDEEGVASPTSGPIGPAQNKAAQESPSDNRPLSVNLDLGFAPDRRENAAATVTSAAKREGAPWREEISERVLSFRQRRARLRNQTPLEESLDFEFERSEPKTDGEPDEERFLEFPQNSAHVDAEIAPPAEAETAELYSEAETQEPSGEVFEIFDSPRPRTEDFEIEPGLDNRLEIVVGPSEAGAPAPASTPEVEAYTVASMGHRFLAGLIDGLFLLLCGGLFAAIFLFAGGHLAPTPLNLAVLGVITFIFVWSYFGIFTALTFSTPGQAWMGIEARNMEGWPPAPGESCLRAFGYLVSLSAFMLGFFWALVDSDSLTWHDRISGTFLTPVEGEVQAKEVDSKP